MTGEGESGNLEEPGRVDSSKYNTISNKYPNEALPSDGKKVEYTIVDGKIKVSNGTRYFDFVVDKDGNLIIGSRHHYLGNADGVIAAGQIKLNGDGKLMSIDNGSGHYKPSATEMEVYPIIFKELGVDIGGTWVKTYDKSGTYIEKIFQLDWNQGDN